MPGTDTKKNENPEPANSPIAKLTDGREGKNSIDNPAKMNPAIFISLFNMGIYLK